MVRYLETFFRHRLLLTLPIAIAIVGTLGFVAQQPRVYSASVKIWVDRSAYGLTATDNAYLTPAQEQAEVITELLRTRAFCLSVGAQGKLTEELRSQAAGATGPVAKLQALVSPNPAS